MLLPLAWGALIVLFFSLAKGKRDVYIMPAMPMTALLVAPWIEVQLAQPWMRRTLFALAAIGGLAFAASGALILTHAGVAMRELAHHSIELSADSLGWMLAVIGTAFLVALAAFRMRKPELALLAGLSASWLAWSLWAYPLLNDSNSARGIMRIAGRIAPAGDAMALVGWKEQNLLFADRPVTEFGFVTPFDQQFAKAIAWQAQQPAHRWIFALDLAMGECVDRTKATHVGRANRREWWMFRADAVKPGCAPTVRSDDDPTP